MRSFKHINAKTLDHAVDILKENRRAQAIAGGTDLLGTLKDRIHPEYPELLVNLKNIDGLAYIREKNHNLQVGALTRLSAIVKSQVVNERYPSLSEAARAVASPQIRQMGTIGGNICQEPRCWYYRNPDNTFYCTRKGGKYCNALTGENQYHSVFGAALVSGRPCSMGCPAGVDIPSYMEHIREGNLSEAARILLESNPMPAITGRVCPHFCERECNRGEFDESVSIRGIERFIGDYVLENAKDLMSAPRSESGTSVAVVGSGPAGLSAAYYLRMLGHRVTVFDRLEEPGGMLTNAIPSSRLPRNVVRRFISALENTGIEFKLKEDVGKDVSVQDLQRDFDSLFFASGTWQAPSIGLEGERLTRSGLEFLTNVKQGKDEVPGDMVVVVGGGDVAVDVAITAKRLGAERVTLICLESRQEMPALESEIEQAIEEGIEVMPSWGPLKVLDSGGKVAGVEVVHCTSVFDENGCFDPALDTSVRRTVEADQIILAVGQRADLSFIDREFALNIDRGLITIDDETQQTSIPGIFAGGDVTSGPATVIESVVAGKRAAEAINHYLLKGEAAPTRQSSDRNDGALLAFNPLSLKETSRASVTELPVSERSISAEDVLGLTRDEIEAEADRCFNCGCVAVNASDIAPVLIALNATIRTTTRELSAEKFFSVKPMTTTVLESNELVREIDIPEQGPDDRSAFLKFRTRESIDFPIVNVAVALNISSKTIRSVRIVLGAVAPIPLRAKPAEDFLTGRDFCTEVAEKAAEIAVEGVYSLEKNEFKVEVTKALIKRAIVSAGS